MQIEVDLEVFKALTSKLEHEKQTHNDIIRELLELDSLTEPSDDNEYSQTLLDQAQRNLSGIQWGSGFYSRGLLLPNGTALRARYKGQEYRAQIESDGWKDSNGNTYLSPSAAARAITGNSVNGWRFWEAWRPGDTKWRRLDLLG